VNKARKGALMLAAAAMTLGTAAYAGSASAATYAARAGARSHAQKLLKVALVAPSATNDLNWTQSIS
jgi:hypothetical protein